MKHVLAFHDIRARAGLSISPVAPRAFADHLKALSKRGFEFVPLSTVGDAAGAPALVVTLDDAFESQLEAALPILTEQSIHATAFVVTDGVGKTPTWDYTGRARRHADWGQLREWCDAGMSLGSHSASHRDLRSLGDDVLLRELEGSRKCLEDHTGYRVEAVAYPFGRYDERVRARADAAGYRFGLTTRASLDGKDLLAWPRIVASRLDTCLSVEQRLCHSLWGRLERGKQRIISYWSGGTTVWQLMQGALSPGS